MAEQLILKGTLEGHVSQPVLATRGTQRSIGRDGDRVDVAGVADVISLQLAAGELPDLWWKPFLSAKNSSPGIMVALA
jgi:hypothetical protein